MKAICLSLQEELKEQLTKEAKEKGLSLNSYIRMILATRNRNDKE